MPESISKLLLFFSTDHLFQTLIAGTLAIWIGMALYQIAKKSRWWNVALKFVAILVTIYGGAHASGAILVLLKAKLA